MKMFCIRATMLALVLVSLIGCRQKPAVDYEARFDTQVDQVWSKDSKWVDAVQHFEGGGYYADLDEEDEQPIDRPHVLPLLKRLESSFGLEWQAILEKKDPQYAVAVVARLPADPTCRPRLEEALKNEQKTFPGAILQQWGHKWVSLDFLNEEDAKFAEQDMSE